MNLGRKMQGLRPTSMRELLCPKAIRLQEQGRKVREVLTINQSQAYRSDTLEDLSNPQDP